jgi:RNA polymerase sigma factor (sigma-70 family)
MLVPGEAGMKEINDENAVYEMARVIARRKANGFHYREDIISEAYVAVAEGVSDPGEIQNIVRKALRKEWKRENSYSPLEIADSLMRQGAPERARVDVWEALEALNERQQAVVVLTFWEGLSQAEIVKELGMSQPTVHRTLNESLFLMHKFFAEANKIAEQNALGK